MAKRGLDDFEDVSGVTRASPNVKRFANEKE